jgi:hypothetical protein
MQIENENSFFPDKKPVIFFAGFPLFRVLIPTRILSGFPQVFCGNPGVFLREFYYYALAPGLQDRFGRCSAAKKRIRNSSARLDDLHQLHQ